MHSYGEVIKLVSPKVNCLNPCFNGRCTRTQQEPRWPPQQVVLILVVMEDALAPGVEPVETKINGKS